MGLSRGEQGVLESFHGAFDRGELGRILSESMLVGFGAPGSCFSCSVLGMLHAQWTSVSVYSGSLLVL